MSDTDFLKMYSTEDLKKVVAEREALEQFESGKPEPLEKPDYEAIYAAAVKHIDYVARWGGQLEYVEEHWIYEAVMDAIYGPSVWDWINGRE